jgi:hypothetical protein
LEPTASDVAAAARDSPERAASALGRPLRLALLLDKVEQPAWVNAALADVAASGIAQIVLVILNAGSDAVEPARRSALTRAGVWYRNRRHLPYALYSKLDERRYRPASDPFSPVDISPLLKGCAVVRVTPRQTKFCDYFDDDVVQEILRHRLDVALRFGFRILKGRALEIARFGIWSFHHGDNRVNRGGPTGFWEVMEHHDTTGAMLQRLTEDLDGGQVLARSTSRTNFSSVSINRAISHWQAGGLLTRELRRLHAEGTLPGSAAPPEWSAYCAPLYTTPSPLRMASSAVKLAARLVRGKVENAFWREQWFLAYARRQADRDEENVPHAVMFHFKEILPPPDRFWADPFPVAIEGRHWIFFEELPFAGPHAHISVLEIDAKGRVGPARPVLRLDYHLSYPFVFRWEGEWYMVPETLSRRSVELFRARRFPDEWEFIGPMLTNVDAVDATLEEIDGRWWLFAGNQIPGTSDATALHLYHGPSPLGPWTPHRYNPVKVDIRGARPAGRLFRKNGILYRPGQDGAPRYGSGTIVHRIDEITPTSFRETAVARILPTWRPGLLGTHTLNAAGGLTVIDVLRNIPRWRFRRAQ